MSGRKRSRADFYKKTAPAGAVMVYRPPVARVAKRRRLFAPGQDRVGGFYGRFSGRGGELKFHDVALTDAVVATAGAITETINIIPQGVTESQRIGRKCTIRSIHWTYQVSMPEQDAVMTPAGGDTLRIILYLDKQCNGETATALLLLETDNVRSFRNLSNSGRFNFLYDKIHNTQYMGLASDGAAVVSQASTISTYRFNKKCDIPIEFNSTTGAIAEIRSNNLGVMLISNQNVVGFSSQFRLRFSDN